jgi:hypothetical protein
MSRLQFFQILFIRGNPRLEDLARASRSLQAGRLRSQRQRSNHPFLIHHSPFTIHHSPFTIHYSLFAIRYSLFAIRYFVSTPVKGFKGLVVRSRR